MKSPHFGQGHPTHPQDQGLAIHIRSAPYREVFSYISDIAIQIGDQILESGAGGKHSLNGEPQALGATERLAGYQVRSEQTEKGRYIYSVRIGNGQENHYHGQELFIREYKDWISISLLHAKPADFRGSIGLMGSYPLATWYGRDGVTIHTDMNEFGSDWIIQGDVDGFLFQEPSLFPDKCALPSQDASTKRRRLHESSFTRAEALEACAHWPPEAIEDCVMDVLVADDLGMALNVPF